jgi:hypothetical protein
MHIRVHVASYDGDHALAHNAHPRSQTPRFAVDRQLQHGDERGGKDELRRIVSAPATYAGVRKEVEDRAPPQSAIAIVGTVGSEDSTSPRLAHSPLVFHTSIWPTVYTACRPLVVFPQPCVHV